jgi:acetoin utilization deacetylase AcuC-like enzyme
VVAVSAGFDTHDGDLASLGLTEKAYQAIGKRVAGLRKPTFFVLEGGYSGENLGKDIDRLLKSFETSF